MIAKVLIVSLLIAVASADYAGYVYGSAPQRFCGKNNLKWTDAKKKCADVDLQLCHAMELCPNRHNTFTDFELMPFLSIEFLPVADQMNVWMNTYVKNVHPMCEIVVNPDNGMTNNFHNYKGDFYCCPKCYLKRFWLGHQFTWQEANDFCRRQTMREKWEHRNEIKRSLVIKDDPYQMHLCSSVQVCRGEDPRWMGEASDTELWSPVSDLENEWVMVANDQIDTCKTYTGKYDGNRPAWGTDNTCEYQWKGYVSCCGIRPRHAHKLAILADEAGTVPNQTPSENADKFGDEEQFVSFNDFENEKADPGVRYIRERTSRSSEQKDVPVPMYSSADDVTPDDQ